MCHEIGFRAYSEVQPKVQQICQDDIDWCNRASVVLGHFAAFWSILGTAFRNAQTVSRKALLLSLATG
jgi:hypothetical protein